MDDPHIGGIGFSGPTTGDLAAIYWNPAALGLLEGHQATFAATSQFVSTTVARSPIDAATGRPGGGRSFPEAQGGGTSHPFIWPPGPGGFAAVGAPIGKRFSLALAAYAPFVQRTVFHADDAGDAPSTRYHAVATDLRNVALLPALALKVGNDLWLGMASGFLFSTARLAFDEDTALAAGTMGLAADCGGAPCGVENPAAAARYQINSGLGLFESSLSFTIAGGVHWRRGRLSLGLAFASRPLGHGNGNVAIDAGRTQVIRPLRDAAQGPLCPPDQGPCVFGEVAYPLPDVITAGASWRATSAWELTGILRWLTFSRHDRVDIRIVGPSPGGLRSAGLPESLALYRGFRDVLDARVRAAYLLRSMLRLGVALRIETTAVPADHLSPAAIDGFKIEPAVMAEGRPARWIRFTAGYAFTFMPGVVSDNSVFDPAAATACEDAGGDLRQPSCRARLDGYARPTAAGDYQQSRHAVSLNATVRF